jgi:hypothetical protein
MPVSNPNGSPATLATNSSPDGDLAWRGRGRARGGANPARRYQAMESTVTGSGGSRISRP